MDNKRIIVEGMASDNFTEEFIMFIYEKVLYTEEEKGFVGDFLPYLKANQSATIETISDLKREFKRFNTKSSTPQNNELWLILSAKLLDLEKQGIVHRSANDKKYNNSNNTVWWIDNKVKNDFNMSDLFNLDIKYKKQGKYNKILSPTNAETFIFEVFKKAKSALSMEDLFYIVKNNIDLYKEESIDDEISQEEGESSKYDIIAASELISDIYIQVEDEGNSRSKIIWNKIIKIERGKNKEIKANKIFCLYLLPKYSGISQPVLEDFGPSSTVSNLVDNDLQPVLRKYLHFDNSSDYNLNLEIQKYIFSKLNQKCSEIGYNTNLNI